MIHQILLRVVMLVILISEIDDAKLLNKEGK